MTTASNLATTWRGAASLRWRRAALAASLLVVAPFPALAQRALEPAEDATLLRRGVLRMRALATWTRFDERFGEGSAGRASGEREPLGTDLSREALGAPEIESLRTVQSSLRELSGLSDFALSLGPIDVSLDATVVRTPIIVELGLASWLTLSVNAPYVRTRTDVSLNANRARDAANVGFNPASSAAAARTQNGELLAQLGAAARTLEAAISACQTDPTGAACPAPVRADIPAAQALLASTAAYAQGITDSYGTATTAGAPIVPRVGSAIQMEIERRRAALNASLRSTLGATSDLVTTNPAGAPAPIALDEAQRLLADESFALGVAPLETVERSHWGDIEVGAKVRLFDTFRPDTSRRRPSGINVRAALGALVRLGTGQGDSPDDLADIGTGDGQNDVEVRLATDLLLGSRFSLTAIGRYGVQLADRQFVRIPESVDLPFVAAYRRFKVDRDLGDYLHIELAPRYAVNEYFGISARYWLRSKAQDRYSGVVSATGPSGEEVTLDPSTLDRETEARAQHVGGGLSYSTVAAFERGVARLPLELFLTHGQALSGSGNAPVSFTTTVELRIYTRLFGGRGAMR